MKINFGKPRDRIQKDEKEEEKKERGMGKRRGGRKEGELSTPELRGLRGELWGVI